MLRMMSVCLTSMILSTSADAADPNLMRRSSGPQAELGAVFGTPGVFNVAAGLREDQIGGRISGMYLGDIAYGAQGNLNFQLSDLAGAAHSIALVGGYMNLDGLDYAYAGPAYNLNTRGGFFLEVGLTIGQGEFSSPQFIFQIGFLKRIPTAPPRARAPSFPHDEPD